MPKGRNDQAHLIRAMVEMDGWGRADSDVKGVLPLLNLGETVSEGGAK